MTDNYHNCQPGQNGTEIGPNCIIHSSAEIYPGVVVGDGCKIQGGAYIFKGVVLEEDVFVGPCVCFTNIHNPRAWIPRMDEIRQTLVKRGASIGANATIVCGVTIGEYAMIGAGAVVTKDVEDHTLVVGVPARRLGYVDKEGNRIHET